MVFVYFSAGLFVKRSPGRNPGRVLNPISYEKPVREVSMYVPNQKPAPGAGFSDFGLSNKFHFWNNELSGGIQCSCFLTS
jgi:hypothetical protein